MVQTWRLQPFAGLQGAFNNMIEDLKVSASTGWSAFPRIELRRVEEGLVLRAAVPGVKRERLELALEGQRLTLEVERPDGVPAGEWAATRRERCIGRFRRSIRLSDAVDVNNVKARLIDGVLEVDLPFAPEARPRVIDVESQQESPR